MQKTNFMEKSKYDTYTSVTEQQFNFSLASCVLSKISQSVGLIYEVFCPLCHSLTCAGSLQRIGFVANITDTLVASHEVLTLPIGADATGRVTLVNICWSEDATIKSKETWYIS